MNKSQNRCRHGVKYDFECDLCEAELTQTLVATDTAKFLHDAQDLLSENETMRHELEQIRKYCYALGVKNELNSDNTCLDLVKRLA